VLVFSSVPRGVTALRVGLTEIAEELGKSSSMKNNDRAKTYYKSTYRHI